MSTDFLGTQWRWDRTLLVLVVTSLLFAIVAEIAARVDDQIERGIAFSASPTYDSELRTVRDGIIQGRPFGRYGKFQLNSWGFRGPEIDMQVQQGCQRLLVIGGSEMFGLFESPGKDFAAMLQSHLAENGCVEIINAAMAGMSLDAALAYWNLRIAQFKPQKVLIYVTPALQITDSFPAAAAPAPVGAAAAEPAEFRFRFLDWLRQYVHLPEDIEDWRTQRQYQRELARHPADWVIRTPPQAGLQSLSAKLQTFIDRVQSSGAAVILMTHAERVTVQTLAANQHDAAYFEQNYPQVAPAVQLEFNELANDKVREIAAAKHLQVVEIDHALTGCRECFADPVHFSDLGAARAAAAAAQVLMAGQQQ